MRTKAELQKDILNIAMKIQMEFPELTKYIKEMPSLFTEKEIDHKHIETLDKYYNKLKTLLVEYSRNQFNLEIITSQEVINFSSPMHSPLLEETLTTGNLALNLVSEDHSNNKTQTENKCSD